MENTNLTKWIKRWKSGQHFLLVSSANEIVYSSIYQFIQETIQPNENILLPRVILMYDNVDDKMESQQFINFQSAKNKLVVCDINHKMNKIKLRNDLFSGVDVVNGDLKTIYELYLQNGISLTLVQFFFVKIQSRKSYTILNRLIESMPKGQIIIQSDLQKIEELKQHPLFSLKKFQLLNE